MDECAEPRTLRPLRTRRLHPWRLLGVAVCVVMLLACGGHGKDRMQEVRALQGKGEMRQSIPKLRAILDKHPDDAEASYRLGLALVQTGALGEAVFPLQNAAKSQKYSESAGVMLASTLLKTENWATAVKAADQVLAKDPKNQAALVIRSQAGIGEQNGDVALDSINRLLAQSPGNLHWLELRADALGKLNRVDEAESAFRELMTKAWKDDPQGPLRSCLELAKVFSDANARAMDDPKKAQAYGDKAESVAKQCVEKSGGDSQTVIKAAQILDLVDRKDDAISMVRDALAKHPDDQTLQTSLYQRLLAAHRFDEAEKIALRTAQSRNTSQAWNALAYVRQREGKAEAALEAVNKGLKSSKTPDQSLLSKQADLLVALGRVDEAKAILPKLKDPNTRKAIEGRIAAASGHYKQALALYTDVLENWPSNWGVRVMAAEAALHIGDVARAKSEFREAYRHASSDTDAALWLARLYYSEGRYGDASAFALRHIKTRGTELPAAFQLAARANEAVGRYEIADKLLVALATEADGKYQADAMAEMAHMLRRRQGPAAALKALDTSIARHKLDLADPKNEPALLSRVQLLIDTGHVDRARADIAKLVAAHPKSAELEGLAGRVALAAGQPEEAKAKLDEALRRDPHQAIALAGKALILRQEGDLDGAIKMMDQAAAQDPEHADYAYMAARMVMDRGDTAQAKQRFERILMAHPGDVSTSNDFAWLLAQNGGDLKKALQLAKQAVRLSPKPEEVDTLGYVQLKLGHFAQAQHSFEAALKAEPSFATARYHLALTFLQIGDKEKAHEALKRALQKPFPESQEAEKVLARLEKPAEGR